MPRSARTGSPASFLGLIEEVNMKPMLMALAAAAGLAAATSSAQAQGFPAQPGMPGQMPPGFGGGMTGGPQYGQVPPGYCGPGYGGPGPGGMPQYGPVPPGYGGGMPGDGPGMGIGQGGVPPLGGPPVNGADRYGALPAVKRLFRSNDAGGSSSRAGCNSCGGAKQGKVFTWFKDCLNGHPLGTLPPPPEQIQQGTLVFPNHPYIRSPRDYFMYEPGK
jgi:hypothetical protein